jgi:hypothetical protein
MRSTNKNILGLLVFLAIVALVLWFILSRLLIVVFIPVSFWGAVIFVLVIIAAIFLVIDHFFDIVLTGTTQY